MFKYIQVPATGADTDEAVFRTALMIARRAAGHLDFLHAKLDVQQVIVAMIGGDMGGGGVSVEVIEQLERDVEATLRTAREAVEAFCAREKVELTDGPVAGGPTATFRVDTGEAAPLTARYGRTADLTVLGRGSEDEPLTLGVMEAVLLGSGRPLLIVPKQAPARIGGRIAIAWKDTAEAARAVSASLPFLADADSVTVLSVEEGSRDDAASRERLCHALSWHNKATTSRHLVLDGRDAVDVLMEAAAASGADLLVMGGYGHSRMREVVFGGFTRRVLRDANLPVLLAH